MNFYYLLIVELSKAWWALTKWVAWNIITWWCMDDEDYRYKQDNGVEHSEKYDIQTWEWGEHCMWRDTMRGVKIVLQKW